MNIQEFIDKLRPVLERNYAAINFKLEKLEYLDVPENVLPLMRGKIVCPCGGVEYFSQFLDMEHMSKMQCDPIKQWAHSILRFTASRSHIEEDVRKGTLPASALDGSFYQGVVL